MMGRWVFISICIISCNIAQSLRVDQEEGTGTKCPYGDGTAPIPIPSELRKNDPEDPKNADSTITAQMACAFKKMRDAAGSNVDLKIRGAIRTPERQATLWKNQKCKDDSGKVVCEAGPYVAPEGHSTHEDGKAVDIYVGCDICHSSCTKDWEPDKECDTKEFKWLKENAKNYGFTRTITGSTTHFEFEEPKPTSPPVTSPPVTQPPVTQPPVTQPPITQPPVTQPPVTRPPITQPPVTQPPVTQPPIISPPRPRPEKVLPRYLTHGYSKHGSDGYRVGPDNQLHVYKGPSSPSSYSPPRYSSYTPPSYSPPRYSSYTPPSYSPPRYSSYTPPSYSPPSYSPPRSGSSSGVLPRYLTHGYSKHGSDGYRVGPDNKLHVYKR